MASAHIFYDSAVLQSVMSMQIARIKCDIMGYTTTLTDVTGKNNAQLATAIDAVTGMTAVYVCNLTQTTYSSAGKFTNDHIGEIDNCLIAASKGATVTSGSLQSNSTATECILASTASASDDTYNGKYIRFSVTTTKNRYITDYAGTSKTCTFVTTSSAITTPETYVVYSLSTKIFIIGNASSNETACRVAWDTLFPTKQVPLIIGLLGGSGSFTTVKDGVTYTTNFDQAVKVTQTATSATTTSLTHTGQFAIDTYIGKFLGIESSTLGAGQVRKITDSTADVLTVSPAMTAPTGTVVYTVADNEWLCLAHIYLPYAISTYLYATDNDTKDIWRKIVDKYNTLAKSSFQVLGDDDLLNTYLQRGKCIYDAKIKGVVS